MRRLTEAVYDGAARERGDPVERPQTRVLPGPGTVVALVAVLALLAGLSVWRSLSGPGLEDAGGPVALSDSLSGDEGGAAADSAPSGGGAAAFSESGALPGGGAGLSGGTDGGAESDRRVIVYVTGQVGAPGVVELPAGSRVVDAVAAAGGVLPDADLSAVNMARILADGEHIVLWRLGEAPGGASGAASTDAGAAGAGDQMGGGGSSCVDLNTADQARLETLDGVGPALAGRILAYREQVGRIDSAEQLDEVPGIGPALVARIGTGVCG